MIKQINILLLLIVIFFFGISVSMAMPIGQATEKVANRLYNEQIKDGIYAGSWPGEINFTGSIVAGLVKAYEINCNSVYKSSAELGGDNILLISQGNLFGDEAYALTCLCRISPDPNDNLWRDTVSDFYENTKNMLGGTETYIVSSFYTIDSSIAVFYMSNHVMSAYYVDAEDKEIWRQQLICLLSHVNDSSAYPVMALGAALWALSHTGVLDETSIPPISDKDSAPYWNDKKLRDLPTLLISHQVQENLPNAGSFYWQFAHTESSLNGFTEDAIFATLGLIKAYEVNNDPNLYISICNARSALFDGIDTNGKVWEKLSKEGAEYNVYLGEMLQVMKELILPGDINLDCNVDLTDFEIFCKNWEISDCTQEDCWCNRTDLDRNGITDIEDFYIFIENWLQEMNVKDIPNQNISDKITG